MSATTMSQKGIVALRQREGCVLHTYLDSQKVPTCCVGHTGRMSGVAPKMGQTFTVDQADVFLAGDLGPVEAAINKALKVPVTVGEFDAMASLWFNVGTGYVKTSSIIRCLNVGDIEGASRGFDAYHKPAEIIGRRNGEKAQFLTPDVDTAPIAAARAGVLETKAGEAKVNAFTLTKTTAASAIISAATVTASVTAGATHPAVAVATGGAFGFAAIVQAFAAWWHTKRAGTLTANAAAQRAVAAS